MNRVEDAVAAFDPYSCAQAMLVTYGPAFGLDPAVGSRVAAALGGGLGLLGRTCGAVVGAFLLAGLLCSEDEVREAQGRKKAYGLARRLAEAFEARHGTVCCPDLLGCDISTEAGSAQAVERDLFSTVCPAFVRDAAELFEELAAELKGVRDG